MPIKKDWPATAVELSPIDALVPYVNNARMHSDAQVDQIAASMREWGWTNPVLIDDENMIIAGHGRILAARKLGIKDAPVMVAKGWTEAQKKAYVLADNQLALNAGWDTDLLSVELRGLEELDFNLDLLGFDDLAALMLDKTAGLTDPDDVPETPDEAVTVTGDLWAMGNHRLVCGDSTQANDVLKLLGPITPHLMVTDPPYGVEYDANWRNEADRANGKPYGASAIGKVSNDDRADWTEAYSLFDGEVAYVWHAGLRAKELIESLAACGFTPRAQIIWAKSHFPIGRGHYHVQHEPCWYAVRSKNGATGHWQGDRTQSTLWQIDKPVKSETGHSTQKPVECMRRPIINNSSIGQAVYDPFLGSGTTIIAAEMEGRHCYGLELHPPYCDVIVKRWQDFTGEKATLEGDGRTFDEISTERQG